MKIETIRKNHKKEIIISIVAFLIIAIVLIVGKSFAKYSLVKNIKIAEGTINYKVPDFKIMAMYKNDGSGDTEITTMPESGYIINESKSYCTLDNINKDPKVKLYTNDRGKHIFENMTKSEKCYLYFDKIKISKINTILGELNLNTDTPTFGNGSCLSGSSIDGKDCLESTNGVYKAKDDDGDTYFFRGTVNNNHLQFANKMWRIIRINGDGTIRVIYDRYMTSLFLNNGTDDQELIDQCFSKDCNVDNASVGFKYTDGQVHGLSTKSNALEQLETWYQKNLLSYAAHIDTNAGFCGDRTTSTSTTEVNNLVGTGSSSTYYGAYIRLINNPKKMSLTCPNINDLYTVSSSSKGNKSLTYPIGLITADEVVMGGISFDPQSSNSWTDIFSSSNYLFNGETTWTMTPIMFANGRVGRVMATGNYGTSLHSTLAAKFNLRPVINLRSDTKFTFNGTGEKGTLENPYIVS